MFSKLSRIVLGVALIALIAGPAFASTQEGSMSGVVLDKGGNPLPGVTVTVKGPALQGEKMAVTDSEGRWRVALVPVGRQYQVNAFIDGFQRVIQTEITVNIAANSRVDFTMVEGTGDLGEITVTAEAPLIDAKKTSISETITYEFMEDIPTGRSYFDAMSMAAGVAGFGNVYTHGADNTDNVFLVDGVDTTDNATGTFGMNFSYEAIQEVEMKTGAFEAEYGRATGAISNVVTKSGGNEFHGAVPIYYTNLDMRRHQELARQTIERSEFYEVEPGVSLGGPILRDKLWFFGAYNNFTRRITGEVTFTDPDTGEEVIEQVKRNEIFEEWMGKVTWQLNPDNKIVAQYASDPATIDSRDAESDTMLPSAYGVQEQGGDLYKLQWTSIFTPNLFLETRIATHAVNLTIGAANAGEDDRRFIDQNASDPNNTTQIYGNTSSWTNIERPRNQYSATLNYYVGDFQGEHNIKFGVEYQDFEYTENATYPETFTIDRSGDLLDLWVVSSDLEAFNDGDIWTAFIQDSWTFRDNLAINLGLRWETQTQNFQELTGYDGDPDEGGLPIYRMSEAYSLDNLLAPRIGFSWDVNGDGRSKLYANYGRYFDSVGSYLAQNLNDSQNTTWRMEGTYDPNNPPPPFDEESGQAPPGWEIVTINGGGEANNTTIDPNLRANFKDEIVLGYEFEFATDFSAGAKLIYNWQQNLIEDVMANEDDIRSGETVDVHYHITNVPQARRNYKGLELQLKKRLSNNYQFLLVYTLSQAEGSLANSGQAEGLNVYADFAEVLYNRYGYLPWDDRHYLKLNGSYHLPWGVILGTSMGWRSGRPYNRVSNIPEENGGGNFGYGGQYYLDPRGSHRNGHVWWMDLRATKDFNIGDTELSIIVDAFNVWNNQFVLGRREFDDGTETSTFSESFAWMGAGHFTLGVKFSF